MYTTDLLMFLKPPHVHSFVRTTVHEMHETAVLDFTSVAPAEPFYGFPYFVDYFGAEAACKEFVLHAKQNNFEQKQKDSQYVTRHLFIHGLVKSGKSTVLNSVFPAVARRHFPKALFWRHELRLVSARCNLIYRYLPLTYIKSKDQNPFLREAEHKYCWVASTILHVYWLPLLTVACITVVTVARSHVL
jgi:hypothetical protein